MNKTISTSEDFRRELRRLLQRAEENEICVEGGWDIEGSGEEHDWSVEVWRLEQPN